MPRGYTNCATTSKKFPSYGGKFAEMFKICCEIADMLEADEELMIKSDGWVDWANEMADMITTYTIGSINYKEAVRRYNDLMRDMPALTR